MSKLRSRESHKRKTSRWYNRTTNAARSELIRAGGG